MRKTAEAFCLTIVLALVMVTALGLASRAEAQAEVKIVVAGPPNAPTIKIQDKPYFGVCKNPTPPHCDSDEITWRLVGTPLGANQLVKIENVPNHLVCFTSSIPLTFISTSPNPQSSGPPDQSCTADKFGTYWPYVVNLYEVDQEKGTETLIDSTDPGGIIHP